MGDVLKTFKTALQKQMVEGMGAHVAFRGLTIPIDPFLEGGIRTGKKIEFTLPPKGQRRPLMFIWLASINKLKTNLLDKVRSTASGFTVTLTISYKDENNDD